MISISTAKYKERLEAEAITKKAHKPVVKIVTTPIINIATPQPTLPDPQEPEVILDQKAEDIIRELEDEMAAVLNGRRKVSSGIYRSVYGRSSDLCIDIGTVLNKIDHLYDEHTNEVRTFGVRFLTESGTSEMTNCRKSVKHPKQKRKGAPDPKGKFGYNLKSKGTILLSSDTKAYRSVMVSAIYEFQDFKTSRWTRVRH